MQEPVLGREARLLRADLQEIAVLPEAKAGEGHYGPKEVEAREAVAKEGGKEAIEATGERIHKAGRGTVAEPHLPHRHLESCAVHRFNNKTQKKS
jgi:hypothetical protein